MSLKRKFCLFGVMFLLVSTACSKTGSPEEVSEAFLFRYFIELNQRGALELSTGLATKKLQKEIELTQNIRMLPNLDLAQHKPFLDYEFQEIKEGKDGTYALYYDITIENPGGTDHKREVILTAVEIDGEWRVNNFDTFVPKS